MAVQAQRQAPIAPARPRPKRVREEEVLVWPDLVFIEFISAVLFTITFVILSVFINAPLLNRANLDVTPTRPRRPGTSSTFRSSCCTWTRPGPAF